MTRIQASLTKTESELVDQVAALTQTRRTDVIRNALAVYRWFVKQVLSGARVTARKPTGEEVTLETLEMSAIESRANLLSAEEIGRLAREFQECSDPVEAERIRERLVRGFYGI